MGLPLLALLTSDPIAWTVLATLWWAAFAYAFTRAMHAPTGAPVLIVPVATAAFPLYVLATIGTASFGSPAAALEVFWHHFEVSHARFRCSYLAPQPCWSFGTLLVESGSEAALQNVAEPLLEGRDGPVSSLTAGNELSRAKRTLSER